MNINSKNVVKQGLCLFVFIIISVCIIIYLPCKIYNFPPPQKFSGNFLYNPYNDSLGSWQQSNFHAHSVAWNGTTSGKDKASDIINLYRKRGYNYACVSNYEDLAPEDKQPNAINVYEHGYNISKTHELVIMPQRVCYNDFPFFQFASSKQFIINKLDENAKAIALAHPDIRNGYSDDDLKKLTGYNLMEVLNHSVNSSNKWDVVLSAGKPVWIIGDDDTHDINDTNQTFTNWTMINCNYSNKDSLIRNLMNGNAYAVTGKNGKNDNKLVSFTTSGLNVHIQIQNKADSIKLIGQNGIVKKTFFYTDKLFYNFKTEDTYIRTVIYNKATTMFLNPVLRYDGLAKPVNISTATTNFFETFLYKSCLLVFWFLIAIRLNIVTASTILKLLKNKWHQKDVMPQLSAEY